MRVPYCGLPGSEGLFGPEILLNTLSGAGCLRFEDGKVDGDVPQAPLTNAFFVWLGRPIVVVSEGVPDEATRRVADGLRKLAEEPDLPVVFSAGRLPGNNLLRAKSDQAVAYAPQELARAEAFASVTAGWNEADTLEVELDGAVFAFRTGLQPDAEGRLAPSVTLVGK